MEDKGKSLETQIKKLKIEKEKADLRYEINLKDLQLRVRGLEEEEDENTRERVLNIFSELTEKPVDD